MSIFIGRQASKLWKRICTELLVEIKSLVENWMYVLGSLIFQYIHGVAARGVHYLHRPGPTLQDLGFFLLPELGPDKFFISEVNFTIIFLSFVLWTFHPFIFKRKKIYTVLVWCRVFACLCACQALRIITFYSTQLPGPAHHCREGAKLARLPLPKHYYEIVIINIPQGPLFGCGDLIFSSHMIFTLVFTRTYHKYGSNRLVKQLAWLLVIAQSFLIVASRKHYTVDVVVAWYTVNLVVYFLEKKLGDLPDRSAATLFLPVSKDNRSKEEMRPLSGSCGDLTDWRYRLPANGKTSEEGNSVIVDVGNNVSK